MKGERVILFGLPEKIVEGRKVSFQEIQQKNAESAWQLVEEWLSRNR